MSELAVSPETKAVRRHERAHLDFFSLRTQVFFGALIIFMSCLANYWTTLKVGFFASDYDYLRLGHELLSGHLAVLKEPVGATGPVALLSILLDFLIFHTHAFGYHFTNIILLSAAAILTAVLTTQLACRASERTAGIAALWAGLLFSVLPQHLLTVSCISGRAWLLSCVLALVSLSLFLRYKQHGSRNFYKSSLLLFLLALLCHGSASILPLILALMSLLPWQDTTLDAVGPPTGLAALKPCLPYLLIVLAFECSTVITTGSISGLTTRLPDPGSLMTLFVPGQIIDLKASKSLALVLAPLLSAPTLYVIRFIVSGPKRPRDLASLSITLTTAAWLALSLSTISADSRDLYQATVPLTILLALMALPFERALTPRVLTIHTICGIVSMLAIYASWAYLSNSQVKAFREATVVLQSYKERLIDHAVRNPGGVTLLNLPAPYKGIALMETPLQQSVMLSPPMIGDDLRSRVKILDSKDRVSAEQLSQAQKTGSRLMHYSTESGLTPVMSTPATTACVESFDLAHKGQLYGRFYIDQERLPESAFVDGTVWRVQNQKQNLVELYSDYCRIKAADRGLIYLTSSAAPGTTDSTVSTALLTAADTTSPIPDIVLVKGHKITATLPVSTSGASITASLSGLKADSSGASIGLYFAPGKHYQIKSFEIKTQGLEQ